MSIGQSVDDGIQPLLLFTCTYWTAKQYSSFVSHIIFSKLPYAKVTLEMLFNQIFSYTKKNETGALFTFINHCVLVS